MVPLPATAVAELLQVPASPLGVAITRPAGSGSVKVTFPRPLVALGLVIVNVRLVVEPRVIVAAPNTLVKAGGPTMMTDAVAGAAAGASFDVSVLVVLSFWPIDVPITLAWKLHDPDATMLPPV